MKNRTMRAAALLLSLTLITTCFVGGTFAKYTTSADAEDVARVAKFGVELTVANDSNLFSDSYTSQNGLTVETSSEGTNLVAPGTSSVENTGTTTFTISGKPEVAVEITTAIDADTAKDVFLKAGTYLDWTTEDTTDTFTLNEDYYPVKWTLKQTTSANSTTKIIVDKGKLSDVQTALSTYTDSAKYTPNTDLGATFTLDWEWDFDDNGAGTNDKADTLLGQIAADVEKSVAEGNYSTGIGYKFTVTVTQVD